MAHGRSIPTRSCSCRAAPSFSINLANYARRRVLSTGASASFSGSSAASRLQGVSVAALPQSVAAAAPPQGVKGERRAIESAVSVRVCLLHAAGRRRNARGARMSLEIVTFVGGPLETNAYLVADPAT